MKHDKVTHRKISAVCRARTKSQKSVFQSVHKRLRGGVSFIKTSKHMVDDGVDGVDTI